MSFDWKPSSHKKESKRIYKTRQKKWAREPSTSAPKITL